MSSQGDPTWCSDLPEIWLLVPQGGGSAPVLEPELQASEELPLGRPRVVGISKTKGGQCLVREPVLDKVDQPLHVWRQVPVDAKRQGIDPVALDARIVCPKIELSETRGQLPGAPTPVRPHGHRPPRGYDRLPWHLGLAGEHVSRRHVPPSTEKIGPGTDPLPLLLALDIFPIECEGPGVVRRLAAIAQSVPSGWN